MAMVIHSIEDDTGMHCVDVALNDDGSYTVKVFRKDPEDGGRWTLTADYSKTAYVTEAEAFAAASAKVPWVQGALSKRPRQS